MFFIRLATSASTSFLSFEALEAWWDTKLKPPKWLQKASSFLAMASPHAHHFLLSSHPNALLAPPITILSLQHKRTAATNKARSKCVGRVSTNPAGRSSSIAEDNKGSLQVRAVSVDGDTEKKEADVKKPTSYRPVVILPVSGALPSLEACSNLQSLFSTCSELKLKFSGELWVSELTLKSRRGHCMRVQQHTMAESIPASCWWSTRTCELNPIELARRVGQAMQDD